MAEQKYKNVLNILLRQVFNRELKPGAKLPTERQLSKNMNVDRTSLRIALKQLESMEVLDIRQGDGIYVKNFLENAGVDFLRLLFLQDETHYQDVIIDEYLIDEIWEYTLEVFPMMVTLTMKRSSPRDIQTFIGLCDEALANIDNPNRLVEIEILSQEKIARGTKNLLFLLIANSTRPLRKKLAELYVDYSDQKALEEEIILKRAMLRNFMAGTVDSATVSKATRKLLVMQREVMRNAWKNSSGDQKIVKAFLGSGELD